MLSICAQCLSYWKSGIDISLKTPSDPTMAKLFINTNWAHLIDMRGYDPSRYRGYTHAPAIRFSNANEQALAVDKMLDILLAAIQHFKRDDIRYIEWAINEITDNVINHSSSNVGGILQVTNMRQREQIEIVVADAGHGIPGTLRATHPEFQTDAEALDAAIREGVTRDKRIGQGNGLYGTWSICQKTNGIFSIFSGVASLFSPEEGNVQISNNSIPYSGAVVSARIGYSSTFDLSRALTFSGKPHIPTDYIDTHFDLDDSGNATFFLKNESVGFGSRAAGDPVRRKLISLLGFQDNIRILIDLSDVVLVSSSYADEVFGKLFVELGPVGFMTRVELKNVDPLVKNLIDRAIIQRMNV